MITEARRKKIQELIEREGIVNLQQLVERFDVSIYTIRRDLNALEEQGLLKKTHGGAVKVEKTRWIPSMETGKNEAFEEKKKIALKASEFVENGDTIMLMGSTIALFMIPMIQDKNVTIVTNSLDVAKELSLLPNIETILIGGRIKNFRGNILGSRAVNDLRNYYFDKAFIPCAGINSSFGVSTSTLDSADFVKTVIQCTRQNIIIADYRKIGRSTFAKVSDLAPVDLLITDDRADKDELNRLAKSGIRIEVAKTL
ncbi:transcriptional regulator, DeoR family [Geosporobacter subterraneus DSM 17957]|uniref:Transcriptional regulator, DeoR family n=1 Tax=Geosporobacter subterraneus DSM 17957 TaxID=1121919 RepID=A0A1M6LTA6_9FIRM|nr:DeoR/GlpR family DNA-binding transcription regulator [Geosporobacter subterraneus]SHJ74433.1 transcriptional regulator, DeoR family [Geosporobacter subterraneus DSM 17957]